MLLDRLSMEKDIFVKDWKAVLLKLDCPLLEENEA